MGSSADRNGLRGQQSLKTTKETVAPTIARQSLKHQENFRGKNCVGQTSVVRSPEFKQHGNGGTRVQQNVPGNCWPLSVKENVNRDDDLVKYMTDLPGYLTEKRENLQDKALNIGVLDWARLEKWNYKTKNPQVDDASNGSLAGINMASKLTEGSSFSHNAVEYGINPCKSKQLPPPPCDDGVALVIDRLKRDKWAYKLFDKNNEEEGSGNRKVTSNTGNLSSNSRYDAILNTPEANAHTSDGDAKMGVQDAEESDIKRKSFDQNTTLSRRVPSAKLGSRELPFGPREKKIICNGHTKKRIEELQKMVTDMSNQHQSGDKKNIVLLRPKVHLRNSSQEEADAKLTEANKKRPSNNYSRRGLPSSEPHSEVPHLCPRPARGETDVEPHSSEPTLNRTRDEESLSDTSNVRQTELSEKDSMETTYENLVEASKAFHQERAAEATKRGRHPSPNRRFSFSLDRITRSFSLKENSSAPQFTSPYASVKSGPISNCSTGLDAASREKMNGHQRGRSSPLRRLLDPLLKPMGLRPVPSAETDQSLNSFSLKPLSSEHLLQNEKDMASSVRGFLHFSRRNGLPFFRFVVNKKGSIFAAPTKDSSSMGKNASSCSYSFYSIEEIPKKSGSWISNGTKEKKCDFLYNVVAQMEVNSTSFSNYTGHNSTSQYVVKEFILRGAGPRKVDQASPGFAPTRELAAAVVKVCGDSSRLGIQRSCCEDIAAKGFSPSKPSKECSYNLRMNATVILPGGIHGLPNKGVPSPLIERWKSGGSCDCGGWDVGCKLQVLCSENRQYQIPKESKGFLMSDHFELFFQGGVQQDNPIFALTPVHDGVHLVEFDPSISSLQAFFICATIISCQKPCNLAEENNLSECEGLSQTKRTSEGPKNTNIPVRNRRAVSYTPGPPLSPVGRV